METVYRLTESELFQLTESIAVRSAEIALKNYQESQLATKLLTRAEAANVLGKTTRTIDNWIKRGAIQSVKIGGIVRIKFTEIQSFIK